MGEAFVWGLVAGSSLILGGLIALRLEISSRADGLVMAFGAGVLIGAVGYGVVGAVFGGRGGGGEAFVWGLVAGSSLIRGGLIALRLEISSRADGLVMAFGAGVLISAVAYELVQDAFETSGGGGEVAAGLFAGALVFFAGDSYI